MLTKNKQEDLIAHIHKYMDVNFFEPDHELSYDNDTVIIEYFLCDAEDVDEESNEEDFSVRISFDRNGRIFIDKKNYKYLEQDITEHLKQYM